jgi:predicted acylesterase/phospholipase RssA
MEESDKQENNKPFRHIVISGGHIWGLHAIGIIQKCIEEKVLDPCQIKSIYGTSVGSLIGAILAIKPEWNDITDYFINRPWNELIKKYDISPIDLYNNSGIFDIGFIKSVIKPIFDANEIPMDITIGEFYERTNVELYISVTELNAYISECISYKTHSSWRLLDAIYASCCIPIVFIPFIVEDKCYIDGGLFSHYPIENCLTNVTDKDEVLGILLGKAQKDAFMKITKHTNVIDMVSTVLLKVTNNIFYPDKNIVIPYEIKTYETNQSLDAIINFLNSKEERLKVYREGYEIMSGLLEECEIWRNKRSI